MSESPEGSGLLQPFEWSQAAERAAMELAKGAVTYTQAARIAGVDRRELARWREHPEFRERIDSYLEPFRKAMLEEGVADKVYRIAILQQRHEAIARLIAERAAAPEMQKAAGGTTGLLVRSWRVGGAGKDQRILEEFKADTALLAEEREILKSAKAEMDAVEGAGGAGRITVIVDI